MFAFALWDEQHQSLTLARDRLGVKPLYFGWLKNQFVFASELKAVRRHSDVVGEIDRDALALFFRTAIYPAPWSIFAGSKAAAWLHGVDR